MWDEPQDRAFKKVKEILTSGRSPGPVLAYYDPSKALTLQADASKYGLGVVLLQNSRPVAYASKTLTTSEINYAQIEKEMLAILFGCKRFHQYVYGRSFTIETDHRPLIFIMKKPLASAPARLQHMLLQLHKYDIDIVHKPGKDIPLANALSCKFLRDTYPELSDSMDALVHSVMSRIPRVRMRLELSWIQICNVSSLNALFCKAGQTFKTTVHHMLKNSGTSATNLPW
jgi:hypothetical protein